MSEPATAEAPEPIPIESRQVLRDRARRAEAAARSMAAQGQQQAQAIQGVMRDVRAFLVAVWPHLDRTGAQMAAKLWELATQGKAPLPGPIPGDSPELLVVERGRARRAG